MWGQPPSAVRVERQPGSAGTTRCHPERSMRIRLINPHAQSKDPYIPARSSAVSGSSPATASPVWIGYSCPMALTLTLTGKGTNSTRAVPRPATEPGFSRLGPPLLRIVENPRGRRPRTPTFRKEREGWTPGS